MAIHINKISILLITLISISLSHQAIANDPNVDKANVKNLVTPLMVSTIAKTEEFVKTNIITRLATVKENPNKDCLDTCKEVYEDAVDAMKKTIKSVDEGNYVEALVHVSAVGSFMGTCKDSIEEIHCDVNPEMTKFEDWSNGVISDATTKIASVAH
nr:pectinesterase inhibitor [Solanum lycopersicum]